MTAWPGREHALAIYHAALRAADPVRAMRAHWPVNAGRYKKIYVVGAGKAAAAMAREAERRLGRAITAGAINTKYGHAGAPLLRIEVTECAHPIPDEAGVRGAARIIQLAEQARAGDLVLCLISGGASALMPLPLPGISLEEKGSITGNFLSVAPISIR